MHTAESMQGRSVPAQRSTSARPVDGRRNELDSLRLIAILGVLFDHGGVSSRFFPGEVGVRFFLLLSGFLITGTLARQVRGGWRESLPALKTFYAKRALRIWPLYYAVLAVLLLSGEILLREAVIHGLFLTNFVQAIENHWQIPSWFLPHLWTLCVQEQYYLVWPLLFVALHAPGRLVVLAAMFVMAIAFRAGMWLAGLHLQVAFTTLPFASFDALAVGSLLALGHERLRAGLTPRLRLAAVVLAALLGLAGMIGGFVTVVALPTLWLVPLSVLILSAFEGRLGVLGTVLNWRPLVFFGRISLGIYLLHLPVALAFVELSPPWLLRLVEHRTWTAFFINGSATLAAAAFSWFLFERPLQRFKPTARPALASV